MTFKFRWLCDLLQKLEQNRVSKASAASRTVDPDIQVTVTWFNSHYAQIPRHGDGAVAFLSCLFPERRPDRVYNLQRKRLASTFGRSLGLGTSRMKELNSWQERHGSDFPQCVEATMAQAEFDEPGPGHELSLEELNQTLDELAARSPFSSPKIRSICDPREADVILGSLLHRLQSWEAKWLVRMVIKNFSPVLVCEHLVMDQFHFLLRDLLELQNSFEAAATVLSRARISQLPSRPARDCQAALKLGIMDELVPHIGIMVRRPSYEKAKSIKHCCQIAANRQMSLERKYDGEYCQVHIDLTNGNDCIKIFSKSGKDSTVDRVRLHGILEDCLGISAVEGKIKKHCVLEGELLVWNDRSKAIEPFHKIRKHVQRSGRWLGNQADSPISVDEHLMIMLYDILLLDDSLVLREAHNERRRRLESLVKHTPGYAEIGTRERIDFSSRRAPEQLRAAFAKAITQHWEGFVLKGCNDSYIPSHSGGRYIKLKKDYITGLGDTVDFAIVGGRRDPQIEQKLHLGKLSWTSFYIGCLENKAEVQRFDAKPLYRILDVVGEHNVSKDDILFLNEHGKFVQVPFTACREELEVRMDQKYMARPTELFRQAFVAEVYGAGFSKPSGSRAFTLRFPRVLKIHSDRPVSETVSFEELQQMGKASHDAPVDVDSQNDRVWIERLEKGDPKSGYIIDKSQSTTPDKSPGSTTATVTPNMRTKFRSPVLVRTDTNELSPKELSAREETESSRLFRSQSPGQDGSGDSKRKLLSADISVEGNTSSKKAKFPAVAHTAPRLRGSQLECKTVSLNSEGVPRYRDGTAQVCLKMTPPWCKWSDQSEPSTISPGTSTEVDEVQVMESSRPTNSHLESAPSAAPSFREPLAEIPNPSPDHTSHRITSTAQPSVDRSKERGNPELGAASILTRKLVEKTPVTTRAPHPPVCRPILSTPLTSCPADTEVDASKTKAEDKRTVTSPLDLQQDRHSASEPRACSDTAASTTAPPHRPLLSVKSPSPLRPPPAPQDSPVCTPPVLLSACLSHLHTHPTRPMETLLHRIPIPFTYSIPCFLDNLSTASGEKPHIVLVDTARPDAVAQEMKAILNHLRKKEACDGRMPQTRGRVLFLDWIWLRSFDIVEEADMKRHFGGCLAWEARSRSRHRRREENAWDESIRPIFSWRGMLAFGNRVDELA